MNLANKLTLFRIILIPIFVISFYKGAPENLNLSLIIFIIASLTDALDGYIARSRNLITDFGKFMDPLADKLLTSSAFIVMVEYKMLPAWIVIIIISREFAITGLRTLAASKNRTLAASNLGKIKTVFQIIGIVLLLSENILNNFFNFSLGLILIYIALFFTIISGIDYFNKI